MRRRKVNAALVFGAALAAYAGRIRPRMVNYGASADEIADPYPGDGIVPGGRRNGTMATTLDAPPSQVWPWLVQMGCDRAGWYSWDRLDNAGRQSADHVVPDWQSIGVGDHLASLPNGSSWFEVAALEPQRFLGLRAALDLRGRPFDPAGPPPRFYSDSLWGFLLEALPGGRTRLINSGYVAASPQIPLRVADFLFWEPAHWIMQTRQWAELQRRVAGAGGLHAHPHARPPAPSRSL